MAKLHVVEIIYKSRYYLRTLPINGILSDLVTYLYDATYVSLLVAKVTVAP